MSSDLSRADTSARPTIYPAAAKALHWLIVLVIAVQFLVAYIMPAVHRGVPPTGLLMIHAAVGVLCLTIGAAWLGWRATHRTPSLAGLAPRWQIWLARVVQALLYALVVAVPLIGWLDASERGWEMSMFGLFPIPDIAPVNDQLAGKVGDVHMWLAWYALGILVLCHAAAALYHHFVRRDSILRRIAPFSGRR